jgi:hypothetical protein
MSDSYQAIRGPASAHRRTDRRWSDDSSARLPAQDHRGRASGDSSGLLPAMSPRLGRAGLSQMFANWKPWHFAVAGVAALLLALVAIVIVVAVLFWLAGFARTHGGEWFKYLPIPVESAS